jgi:hypothetical protein
MKSFNQFLQESYLNEDEVQGRLLTNRGTAQNFTNPKRIPFTATDPTPTPASRRLSAAGSPEGPRTSPGQMEIPLGKPPKGTNTTVPGSGIRGETGQGGALALRPKSSSALTTTPKSGALATTSKSSNALATIPKSGNLANKSSSSVVDTSVKPVDVKVLNEPKGKLPSGSKPKALPSGASSAAKEAEKVVAKTATKSVGKGILRGAGKLVGPASAALDVADERSKGSGWLRSLAKGAVVAAGGAAGGAAGTAAGPVGTFAGATGGAMAASKAFDVAAGANAKERKAIATANRKGQAGGAIKGIGGKTTFDTNKNTITTGTGAQRKTAQLGKTSVVTNPKTGKQEVGNLAYKDGKAVYKRSDTKSLAQTSSNPLERIGRSLFAGAYKKSDAANAAKKLATARQSDAARNKALGVKFGPGK